MKNILNQVQSKETMEAEHQVMEMHHIEAPKDQLVKVVIATDITKSLIQNVFIQFLKSQATQINTWPLLIHMVNEMEEMELLKT